MVGFGSPVHTRYEIIRNILPIFDEAQERIVVVSPWIKLWGVAKLALQRANERDVKIRFIVRKEAKLATNEDMGWLLRNNVEVYQVKRLHAKIYFNENTVLLSSMNLHETSARTGLDFGITLQAAPEQEFVREFADKNIMALATKWGQIRRGHCIGCRKSIELDIGKPHCRSCHDERELHEGRGHPENYCHSCGEPSEMISLGAPLCATCWPRERQQVEQHAGAVMEGFCISCRAPIVMDRKLPLCAEHFVQWKRYFRGNYCLMCGESARTSRSKPLCDFCV